MTKSIIASLAIVTTVLTLSGCGNTANTDTTTDNTSGSVATSETNTFAIAACNTYIDVMNCMIEKSPDLHASAQDMQDMIDKLIVAWKALTPEQLQTACDATMKVMIEEKASIEEIGCKVE